MEASILFLTNAYPDSIESYRGIFIQKMANFLKDKGYKISVVTPKIYKWSNFFESQNGINVYRFPFWAKNKLLIEYKKIPYLKMVLYCISGLLISIYVVLKRKCNFLHIHWAIPTGIIGVMMRFFLKKPYLVTIHGSDLRIAIEKNGFLKNIFIVVCKKASHIHCVSEFQKIELLRMGLSEEKISVFPMGVDQQFIECGKRREKEIQNSKNIIILSNRNLIPIYNVALLIRSIPSILKEIPFARFIIAGDGAEREKLEKAVYKINLNNSVEFIGRIPHDKMQNLLGQSDIYVSTSLFDGTSVSLLEAMASGCFPVVSDIPSNREWIEEGKNGFLFPVTDESTLAKKILLALKNEIMRESARNLNFSIIKEKALWPVCIEKAKKIYEGILNKK